MLYLRDTPIGIFELSLPFFFKYTADRAVVTRRTIDRSVNHGTGSLLIPM